MDEKVKMPAFVCSVWYDVCNCVQLCHGVCCCVDWEVWLWVWQQDQYVGSPLLHDSCRGADVRCRSECSQRVLPSWHRHGWPSWHIPGIISLHCVGWTLMEYLSYSAHEYKWMWELKKSQAWKQCLYCRYWSLLLLLFSFGLTSLVAAHQWNRFLKWMLLLLSSQQYKTTEWKKVLLKFSVSVLVISLVYNVARSK